MISEYRTLKPYLVSHRFRYAAGLFCLVLVDGAQLITPQLVSRAIDSIATGKFDSREISMLCLGIVLVAATVSAGRFLWRLFIHGASRRIETSLRDDFFAHIIRLPSSFFQRNKTGDIMARATNDMQAVRMSTGMGLVSFIDGVFMSIAILIIIFVRNPRIALFTIIPLPVITALILVFGSSIGPRFQRVQEIYSKMSDIVQETLQGIRVVKSFVKEPYFTEKFAQANGRYTGASMSLVKIFGLFFPMVGFLAALANIILIGVGGISVIENRMSPGEIVAMLAYLEMMVWPMLGAGFTVNTLQRGAASLKRINEFLDESAEDYHPAGSNPMESLLPTIEFRHLSFSYPGSEKTVLSDITLSIDEGSTLGILGRIGSGKSTMLKLLPRFLDSSDAAVFVGGRDVMTLDLAVLRRVFAFVPQDTFLFSDSIRANILFGKPDVPEERFRHVVSLSALDRDLALFKNGWDTMIGERGLTLSGGQKQRVSIARALVLDPPILVLDDALSAVDAQTEEAVLSALIRERSGRTTIIISNRVSTLRHADKIAVMDGGRIVDSGIHDELMARGGFYAEVARLQALSSGEGRKP